MMKYFKNKKAIWVTILLSLCLVAIVTEKVEERKHEQYMTQLRYSYSRYESDVEQELENIENKLSEFLELSSSGDIKGVDANMKLYFMCNDFTFEDRSNVLDSNVIAINDDLNEAVETVLEGSLLYQQSWENVKQNNRVTEESKEMVRDALNMMQKGYNGIQEVKRELSR